MARAVALYFESNGAAENFVKEMQEEGFQVVGLYPVPTQFCDPADPIHKGKGKTGRGYTRGIKYGWWVCAVCKKPTGRKTNIRSLVRATISQAVDLLPDADPKASSQSGTKVGVS